MLHFDLLMPPESPLFSCNGTPGMAPPTHNAVRASWLPMEFVVVDISGPYNVILGRNWLHGMKAIASTYHQLVRFIGRDGWQEEIRGDRLAAKQCHVNAIHTKAKVKKAQSIRIPEVPVLENIGSPIEDKAVEDLVTISINEDGSRYFLLHSSLLLIEQEKMVQFLKDHIGVFAWTPNEMLGVDPPSFPMPSTWIGLGKRMCRGRGAILPHMQTQ